MRRTLGATVALGLWLASALVGCRPACPSEPLAPLPRAPAWAARFDGVPLEPLGSSTEGGAISLLDAGTDAGVGTYAAIALYGADGEVDSERWLDSRSVWAGSSASAIVDEATILPSRMPPGRLTLLLAESPRPVVSFSLPSGAVAFDLPTYAGSGSFVDLVPLDDTTAMVLLSNAPGVVGDVLALDFRGSGGIAKRFNLSSVTAGRPAPGGLAPILEPDGTASRVVVGLGIPDEGVGAVAIVSVDGAVHRYGLPGLTRCQGVAALGTRRVAVLCTGDPTTPIRSRPDAGFALLSFDASGAAQVAAMRPSDAAFFRFPLTGPMVSLTGDWVAVLSVGDPSDGRPDALIVVHLSSDASHVLAQEPWSSTYGRALGLGNFAPTVPSGAGMPDAGPGGGGGMDAAAPDAGRGMDAAAPDAGRRDAGARDAGAGQPGGELWWPSVEKGILRYRMDGDGADATFTALDPAKVPPCLYPPPRVVRHLPPAP